MMTAISKNNNSEIILHLLLCDGVGPAAVNKIVNTKVSLQQLYGFSESELSTLFSLNHKVATSIFSGLKQSSLLVDEIERCRKLGVKLISILDDQYPSMLAQINVPPPLLFVLGNLPKDDSLKLAVVGSRKSDLYGKRCVEKLLPELVASGFVVVSGGAVGIDTLAHRVALDCGGITVVVFGCGFNFVYPESNKNLFKEIIKKNGALISIFPTNIAPSRQTFPVRNRVIAGLAAGTLVIQATKDSGSLITAKYALDEGRELLAVPGQIDSALNDGCHELIKSGAKLVSDPRDVFSVFEFSCDVNIPKVLKNEVVFKNISLPLDDIVSKRHPYSQHDIKVAVLSFLATVKTSDELSRFTGLSLDELVAVLFEMELDGLVQQHFNGLWEKC